MENKKRLKLIDYGEIRTLFDEEYKKTAQLIRDGETHLDNLAEGFAEADRVIWKLPTVDAVEVVHGRWEDGICTMCGYPIPTDSKCDFIDEDDCLFCYHCGAKMKGENEDG